MCCDKAELRTTTLAEIAPSIEQVAEDTLRGPTNMSSELGDVNVLETGAVDANAATFKEETAGESSTRRGVAKPSQETRVYQGDRRKPSLKSFI